MAALVEASLQPMNANASAAASLHGNFQGQHLNLKSINETADSFLPITRWCMQGSGPSLVPQ